MFFFKNEKLIALNDALEVLQQEVVGTSLFHSYLNSELQITMSSHLTLTHPYFRLSASKQITLLLFVFQNGFQSFFLLEIFYFIKGCMALQEMERSYFSQEHMEQVNLFFLLYSSTHLS